ncbi:MAG: NUDIX hydrolase [Clostridia bacterium]|nr:NUDIX hydrolase [Clostridia bacterium]
MKTICTLTDKEVLGVEGLSDKAPRLTARAILQNQDGLYAVMYVEKFNLYSLPGGGIESGENPEDALRRELLEETGCACDTIIGLGKVFENRACLDYTQDNYYYFVKTSGNFTSPKMTQKEIENRTVVQWHTFEDLYNLIALPKHETFQRKYIQARDTAALNEFIEVRSKNEKNRNCYTC